MKGIIITQSKKYVVCQLIYSQSTRASKKSLPALKYTSPSHQCRNFDFTSKSAIVDIWLKLASSEPSSCLANDRLDFQ